MPVNPELINRVKTLLKTFDDDKNLLAEILNSMQKDFGHIPPSTIALIAEKTARSRPEIFKAIELSPSLSLSPTCKHTLYICNADNCCMLGGVELMDFAKQKLGVSEFETTADNVVRLESFECLGNCSMSPNAMIGDEIHGLLDTDLLEKLIDDLLV